MKKNKETLKVLDKLEVNDNQDFIKDNLIFLTVTGSRAYGTSTPESDYDYKGICIPTIDYYVGMSKFDQREDKQNDITIYGISRFFELAQAVNPNIIELLFVDETSIVYKHPVMDRIIENKKLFLSKKAKHSFSGYAFAQLKRIKGHKKWLDNPLKKPERENYGLPVMPKFGKEKVRALATLGDETLINICGNNSLEYIQKESQYYKDMADYIRYKDWREHRNNVRAELEATAGYDTKHASHLIRLIRMAKEIATEKTIHTFRPDREFLMDVRKGKYTYEEIIEMAEKEEAELEDLFEKSDLPYTVDFKKIESLLQSILFKCFNI